MSIIELNKIYLEKKAKLEELNKNLSDLENSIVLKKEFAEKSENEEELKQIKEEIKKIKEDIAALKADKEETEKEVEETEREIANAEKNMDDLKNQIKKGVSNTMNKDLEILNSKGYVEAYAKALKNEDASIVKNYLKDMGVSEKTITTATTGSNNGGLVIPKIVADKIQTHIDSVGGVLSTIKKINIVGDYDAIYETANEAADIHKENTNKNETGGQFGVVRIVSDYIYKKLRVTTKMEALDNGALVDWIMNELPQEIVKLIEDLIFNGAKTAAIQGILTNTDTDFVANEEVTKLDDVAILNGIAHVPNANVIYMARATYINSFMADRDKNGQPKPFVSYDLEKPSLWGTKVVYAEALDEDVAVVGNGENFTLNFPVGQGVAVERLTHDKAVNNTIIYLAEVLVGGAVTALDGFCVLTVKGD